MKLSLKHVDKTVFLHCLCSNQRDTDWSFWYADFETQAATNRYVDYFQGKAIKMDFRQEEVDTFLYDRDSGEGAALRCYQEAQRITAALREQTLDTNQAIHTVDNVAIRF